MCNPYAARVSSSRTQCADHAQVTCSNVCEEILCIAILLQKGSNTFPKKPNKDGELFPKFQMHCVLQGYIFISTTCPQFQQGSNLRFSQTVSNFGCNVSGGYRIGHVRFPTSHSSCTEALNQCCFLA